LREFGILTWTHRTQGENNQADLPPHFTARWASRCASRGNHYYQWALAESYDENVMHGSTQLLLGMLAFGLLHDQTINWNASQGLRKLFVQLQGMALPGLQGMAMADAHNPEFAAELQASMVQSAEALRKDVAIDDNGDISSLDDGGPCSFTSQTKVETSHGEQAIGTLKIGQKVLAYNPKTRKMEYEPILHIWIHNDNDLVDLTITTTTYGHHGLTTKTSEVIHTNKKHPFFTEEQGFVPVGQLKLGMHVLRADGQYGVITGWKIVPGVQTMYNLEVAQDHTFTASLGEWVVHNSCVSGESEPIYSANGDPNLRASRRAAFDDMKNNGIEVNGDSFQLSDHAYNSLFKSGRKDIMPADISAALQTDPQPADPGSVEYVNPTTGTSVFVNPDTNLIVGIWPASFLR
jgi:hypothetical protein